MNSKNKKYCNSCRWSKHEKYISRALYNMRKEKDFCDVTLACGDEQLLAHKAILSACSPLFNSILKRHAHPHPIICIPGAKYRSLQQVLDFMYLGQVPVPLSDVDSFEALADELQVQQVNKDDPEHEENESDDDKERDKEDGLHGGDERSHKEVAHNGDDNRSKKEGAPHKDGERSNKDGAPHTSTYGTRPSVIKTNSRPTSQLKRSHSEESQPTKHARLDTTERPAFTRDERGHDEFKDGPKDVKDDKKPDGSDGLLGANPGGPGGQGWPEVAPGGPGGPPSLEDEFNDHIESGLSCDSQPPRGNRGGGSRERGNDGLFDRAGFGGQDEFFGGLGGQDGFFRDPGGNGRGRGDFGGPQDFDDGFGGIGTSEQLYEAVTNARDKYSDVTNAQEKDTDVTNAQEKDRDVTNAPYEDTDVMNAHTEDWDAQNDEYSQSTIASQSESSIPGTSDVETVESYGDAKEEMQRFNKFVTDNLEVNEDTLVCKICLKTYPRRWNAERHLQTVHFGEEKVCLGCGQFFKHYETLARHHRSGNCSLPNS